MTSVAIVDQNQHCDCCNRWSAAAICKAVKLRLCRGFAERQLLQLCTSKVTLKQTNKQTNKLGMWQCSVEKAIIEVMLAPSGVMGLLKLIFSPEHLDHRFTNSQLSPFIHSHHIWRNHHHITLWHWKEDFLVVGWICVGGKSKACIAHWSNPFELPISVVSFLHQSEVRINCGPTNQRSAWIVDWLSGNC